MQERKVRKFRSHLYTVSYIEAKPASRPLFSNSAMALPFIHLQLPEAWASFSMPASIYSFYLITHIKVLTLPLTLLQNFTVFIHTIIALLSVSYNTSLTLWLFPFFCRIGRINCKWTVEQTKV